MKVDDRLVERLVKKDEEAFAEFYRQSVDYLYRYVRGRYFLSKEEVEDVLSEFYIKFRRVLPQYNKEYKFEAFVRTVFKNLLKDQFKKNTREATYVSEMEYVEDSDPDAMLKKIQWSFELSAIQTAMQELDELSYDLLIMKYVEERTYEEISEACTMQQDAVRKRISRALQKIKQLLE